MTWLALQIVVELLLAAGLGGVIGWALHMRLRPQAQPEPPVAANLSDDEARLRIAELEGQLRTERSEMQQLRKTPAAPANGVSAEPDTDGALAFRNKHLEARVRFLEGKITDLETSAAPAEPPEDKNDEGTRLRWRNRYLEGRIKYLEEELERGGSLTPQVASAIVPSPPSPASSKPIRLKESQPPNDADKPPTLSAPRNGGGGDNLRLITGIGPKIEKALHQLGVWHYDQIAAWSPKQIEWVNATLGANGRIERDRWVPQAGELTQRGRAAT